MKSRSSPKGDGQKARGATSVMLLGLQGVGKTTIAAKLARHLTQQGRKVLLVAADTYRPAAVDQLQTLGASIDVPVHVGEPGEAPPAERLQAAFGLDAASARSLEQSVPKIVKHAVPAKTAGEKPLAYVCRGSTCSPPITSLSALTAELRESSA